MTQFFSTYNKTNVNRVQKVKWQNKKKKQQQFTSYNHA